MFQVNVERLECNGLYCNHQYDCSKFYVIIYNHPVEMKCAPGTRFSLNLGVCDHESNVDCINDVEIQPDGMGVRVPDYENQLGVTIRGNFKDLIENICFVDGFCPTDAMIERDYFLEHIKYQFYMQYISSD